MVGDGRRKECTHEVRGGLWVSKVPRFSNHIVNSEIFLVFFVVRAQYLALRASLATYDICLVCIMYNESVRTIEAVVEDAAYWQAVREFPGGGKMGMQRHPAWFRRDVYGPPDRFDLDYVPRKVEDYPEQDGEEASVVDGSFMEAVWV